MAIERIENSDLAGKLIQELHNRPTDPIRAGGDGLTSQQLRQRYDAATLEVIVPHLNAIIDAINGVPGEADDTLAETIKVADGVTLLQRLAAIAVDIAAKYAKPSGGIPYNDLAPSAISEIEGAVKESVKNEVVEKATDLADGIRLYGVAPGQTDTVLVSADTESDDYGDVPLRDSSGKLHSPSTEDSDDSSVLTTKGFVELLIDAIRALISAQASSSNKLVSFDEMADAISSVEAKQIYKTASQGSFATKAELLAATTFYNADGTVATPTKNDVAYVLADESRDGKTTKYVIADVEEGTITWGFVISLSSSVPFTQAQINALNSGITSTILAQILSDITNRYTKSDADAKFALISSLSNYLQTSSVVQSTGQSTTSVMSQKATTDALDSLIKVVVL